MAIALISLQMIALIHPENLASIRVAEKAGLTDEKDAMLEGYTHPDRVYAITREPRE